MRILALIVASFLFVFIALPVFLAVIQVITNSRKNRKPPKKW